MGSIETSFRELLRSCEFHDRPTKTNRISKTSPQSWNRRPVLTGFLLIGRLLRGDLPCYRFQTGVNPSLAVCYIDAMSWKSLAVTAVLLSIPLVPIAHAQQTDHQAAAPHQAAPTAPVPAAPALASPTASSTAPPATANSDYQQPHITIATPAPAPAPWPLQDRIAWVASLLLAIMAYVGIMLAISMLRKIERHTRYGETAAQAAADSAKAALLLAQSHVQAERPWLLITAEPTPSVPNGFTVVATNRGRGPARIIEFSEEITTAKDESQLSATPTYTSKPHPPIVPMILLPGESTGIKSFRRDDVKSLYDTEEGLRRVEDWEEKIYLYGKVVYLDLSSNDVKQQPYESSWCCWYIHGRQNSGLVMAGPLEYHRHT